MKTAFLFTAAFVSGLSLPLMAQQAAAAADQSRSASSPQSQADQSAAASAQPAHGAPSAKISAMAFDYMRPVNCELAGKLDSKSAKIGDSVVAKTTMSMHTADGTEIPRGAKLMGHVTDVQAHASGQAESHLSLVFDHAEWSGGHSVAIHSVIETVTPPPNVAAIDNDESASSMGGAGSRGLSGLGGTRSGGGALGGTAGAATSTAGNLGANAGGVLHTTGQAAGDVASNATVPLGQVGSSLNAAAAATMGVHATGIPGVMLSGDASGAVSGTLSASKRNVHLDAGSQIILAVSPVVSQ